jgi:hypothetical protein
MKNYKELGEIGERAVVGKLARLGIDVALPMSDNHPFDLIVIGQNHLFKIQVKSSGCHTGNSVCFGIQSTNFYHVTAKTYSEKDCDLILCYDLVDDKIYVLEAPDFVGKRSFTVYLGSHNPTSPSSHLASRYLLTSEKVFCLFGVKSPDWVAYGNRPRNLTQNQRYNHVCLGCGDKFQSGRKKSQFCSNACFSLFSRKVVRPNKESLLSYLTGMSIEAIGRKYGVSGAAVRKWTKTYGIA